MSIMRRVEPHQLWIGHAGHGRDFRGMLDLGVRAVVQLAVEEPPGFAPRELIVLRFPLYDGGGNEPALLRLTVSAVTDLIRAGFATLICCGAGMSRSPAVAAAVVSRLEGVDLDHALRRVTTWGPADVSPQFWADLRAVLAV